MAKAWTGSLEKYRGVWYVRISVTPPGGGKRKRERIRIGKTSEVSEKQAEALKEKIVARIRSKQAVKPKANEAPAGITVQQWGEMWTSGRMLEQFGPLNGLKVKKDAQTDASRLATHVYPVIGSMAVAAVTDRDIDRVMARIPRDRRAGTRERVLSAMRRLFDLAIVPGRLRKDNPVSKYHKPAKDSPKLFAYLFPQELLALLRCEDVDTDRKILYALGCYTGLRKGSLFALMRSCVDKDHDVLLSTHSKTGLTQYFEIDAGLAHVIRRWIIVTSGAPGDPLIPRRRMDDHDAQILRADLRRAGVTRGVLFMDTEHVEPLRFHDLRGTFVTWAKRAGKGDGWIADRTGHLTPEMITRYTRAARTLSDLQIEPFPSLIGAIPEIEEGGAGPRIRERARAVKGANKARTAQKRYVSKRKKAPASGC